MARNNVYKMSFSKIYPLYVSKAEKKGRNKKEVDEIIIWLTGYNTSDLENLINSDIDLETFFDLAPLLNPNRTKITGSICGVKIDEITEPLMKEIRYLDKLIDDLAKGKSLDKILMK